VAMLAKPTPESAQPGQGCLGIIFAGEHPCETKPICHRRAGKAIAKAFGLDTATRTGAYRAKQSQSRPTGSPIIPLPYHSTIPSRRRLCETKPILGDTGWGETPGRWDAGQSCKTKPNLGRMGHLGDGAWGGQWYETKPIGPAGGDCGAES
jgi:hypothetical protein